MSIFKDLSNFGLKNLENIDVFAEEKEEQKKEKKIIENGPVKLNEADFVFEKTFRCPVCDREFKSKFIKTGKVKLLSMDTDLRPKYQDIDSLKYDAVVCPNCGYAALNRFFNFITAGQKQLIKENISKNFVYNLKEGDIYTYDDAIEQHKLALINAIVKKSKVSERAYICLKLAWLCRGKIESLGDSTENESIINELKKQEDEFIKNAYEGFYSAVSKERFPICGMDDGTVTYLLADLARRTKNYDESARFISKILVSRDVNERIKNKAREIKELLLEEKVDTSK